MISLTSQPSIFNLLTSPMLYSFTMSSTNVGGVIRRLGYQLLLEDDTPITGIRTYPANDNDTINLSFANDIRSFLKTNTPRDNQNTFIESRPEMLVKVKLKYWEFVYEDCGTTIENEVTTSLYTIVNSVNQFWGYRDSSFARLTNKMDVVELCVGQYDLYYLYESADVDLIVHHDTGDLLVNNGTTGAGVSDVMISTDRIIQMVSSLPEYTGFDTSQILETIQSIELIVNNETVVTYYIKNDCCDSILWFQESAGGYTSICVCVQQEVVTSSQTEICEYQPSSQPYNSGTLTTGGRTVNSKKARLNKTLYFDIDIRDEMQLRFTEDLLASRKHLIQFQSIQGSKQVGFILTNSSTIYNEKEKSSRIILNGYINQPYNLPS